jgi:hypothetical protein
MPASSTSSTGSGPDRSPHDSPAPVGRHRPSAPRQPADTSTTGSISGRDAVTRFGVSRLYLTSFFGLAMVVTFTGILLVMLGVLIVPERARWLALPGVVLLVAGLVLAVAGQLAVAGRRACLVLTDEGWLARPMLGRSRKGTWQGVQRVRFGDDGALLLQREDGTGVALATRHLAGTRTEFTDAVRQRLDAANGYRTLAQAEADADGE